MKTVTTTPSTNPSPTETQTSEDKSKPKAKSNTFVMPNEVGKDLQAAQDHVQRVSGDPFFFSYSKDARSDNRIQILDWLPRSQTHRAPKIETMTQWLQDWGTDVHAQF